jgi:REP element-mobilizing transposase RayT
LPRNLRFGMNHLMARGTQAVLSREMAERVVHGGESSLGKRKRERPIATKRAIHIVLRSSHAQGEWSFLHPKHAAFIRLFVPELCKRLGIIVYESANVGNHLHFLLRPRSRDSLKRFLMVLSGRLAQRITGAVRGRPFGKRFFDYIPFSRIVEWGRAFKIARDYVVQNFQEAMGLAVYRPRVRKGKKTRSKSSSPPPPPNSFG